MKMISYANFVVEVAEEIAKHGNALSKNPIRNTDEPPSKRSRKSLHLFTIGATWRRCHACAQSKRETRTKLATYTSVRTVMVLTIPKSLTSSFEFLCKQFAIFYYSL